MDIQNRRKELLNFSQKIEKMKRRLKAVCSQKKLFGSGALTTFFYIVSVFNTFH